MFTRNRCLILHRPFLTLQGHTSKAGHCSGSQSEIASRQTKLIPTINAFCGDKSPTRCLRSLILCSTTFASLWLVSPGELYERTYDLLATINADRFPIHPLVISPEFVVLGNLLVAEQVQSYRHARARLLHR